MSSPTLVLAETPSQIRAVRAADPSVHVVAVTPAADYAVETEGLANASIVEDHVADAVLKDLGIENAHRTIRLIAAAQRVIERETAGLPGAEDGRMDAFFHHLKQNIDGFTARIEQVHTVLETLKPRRLHAFRVPLAPATGISILNRGPWGLTSHFAPLMAAQRGIEVVWHEHPGDDPSVCGPLDADSTSRLRLRFRQHAMGALAPLFVLLAGLRRLRTRRPLPAPGTDACPLLLHELFADTEGGDIIDAWRKRIGGRDASLRIAIAGFPRLRVVRACARAWRGLRQDADFRATLVHRETDFFPLFEDQLRMMVRLELPFTIAASERAAKVLPRLGTAAILTGGIVGPNYALARAAARAGVPVVTHHYGGFMGFAALPNGERYDMAEVPWLLTGGKSAADFLRKPHAATAWPAELRRAEPVPTGLPWVAKLVQSARSKESGASRNPLRIMVILSSLPGDSRYLGYVYPPDILYWRFTRKLVDQISKIPGSEIIIKMPLSTRYPQLLSPLRSWLENRKPHNISISQDNPLKECLEDADAFFVDSPSTPLLHVVATDKPVLCFLNKDIYDLDHGAIQSLGKRCIVFSGEESDFFMQLSKVGERSMLNQSVNDNFLKEYVIGDGGASGVPDKAADNLALIIRGQHPIQ